MKNKCTDFSSPNLSDDSDNEFLNKYAFNPKKKENDLNVIKCFVRIKPSELFENNSQKYFKIDGPENKILLASKDNFLNFTKFNFERVFDEICQQKQIFEEMCQPLIDNMLKTKRSSLLFSYGMTNSGKTYTMIGNKNEPGLIIRSIEYFFRRFSSNNLIDPLNQPELKKELENSEFNHVRLKEKNDTDSKYSIYFSIVEVYNEEIFDLLGNDVSDNNNNNISLNVSNFNIQGNFGISSLKYSMNNQINANKKKVNLKMKDKFFCIPDLKEIPLNSIDEFHEIFNIGITKKTHAPTCLNSNSSRSHCIFRILLKPNKSSNQNIYPNQNGNESNHLNDLCFTIVDLAGSERVNKSEVSGINFDETKKINLSLTCLARCFEIMKLNVNSTTKNLIPFRDSILTKILQECFLSDYNIAMISTINSLSNDFDESIRVLNFAGLTGKIITQKTRGLNFDSNKKNISYSKYLLNGRLNPEFYSNPAKAINVSNFSNFNNTINDPNENETEKNKMFLLSSYDNKLSIINDVYNTNSHFEIIRMNKDEIEEITEKDKSMENMKTEIENLLIKNQNLEEEKVKISIENFNNYQEKIADVAKELEKYFINTISSLKEELNKKNDKNNNILIQKKENVTENNKIHQKNNFNPHKLVFFNPFYKPPSNRDKMNENKILENNESASKNKYDIKNNFIVENKGITHLSYSISNLIPFEILSIQKKENNEQIKEEENKVLIKEEKLEIENLEINYENFTIENFKDMLNKSIANNLSISSNNRLTFDGNTENQIKEQINLKDKHLKYIPLPHPQEGLISNSNWKNENDLINRSQMQNKNSNFYVDNILKYPRDKNQNIELKNPIDVMDLVQNIQSSRKNPNKSNVIEEKHKDTKNNIVENLNKDYYLNANEEQQNKQINGNVSTNFLNDDSKNHKNKENNMMDVVYKNLNEKSPLKNVMSPDKNSNYSHKNNNNIINTNLENSTLKSSTNYNINNHKNQTPKKEHNYGLLEIAIDDKSKTKSNLKSLISPKKSKLKSQLNCSPFKEYSNILNKAQNEEKSQSIINKKLKSNLSNYNSKKQIKTFKEYNEEINDKTNKENKNKIAKKNEDNKKINKFDSSINKDKSPTMRKSSGTRESHGDVLRNKTKENKRKTEESDDIDKNRDSIKKNLKEQDEKKGDNNSHDKSLEETSKLKDKKNKNIKNNNKKKNYDYIDEDEENEIEKSLQYKIKKDKEKNNIIELKDDNKTKNNNKKKANNKKIKQDQEKKEKDLSLDKKTNKTKKNKDFSDSEEDNQDEISEEKYKNKKNNKQPTKIKKNGQNKKSIKKKEDSERELSDDNELEIKSKISQKVKKGKKLNKNKGLDTDDIESEDSFSEKKDLNDSIKKKDHNTYSEENSFDEKKKTKRNNKITKNKNNKKK